MKKVTELGRFVRTKRMDLGRLSIEQAKFLDVTPSMVSSVEFGRKKMPESWLEKLRVFLELSDREYEKLQCLVAESDRVE